MMGDIMKKLVYFLLAVLLMFSLAACGKGGEPPVDRVVIGGFESIKELKTFLYSATFNKAELNSDKMYVTEGKNSAKFTVRGGADGAVPKFDLFLDMQYANYKVDFTDVRALTADVWNASDEVKEMSLSLTTRQQGTVRATYLAKSYRLQPGYNRVIYTIDRSVANDICYMDRAEYVTVTFENSYAAPYAVYMDNLLAHLTDEEIEPVTKEYKENELLFFDDYSDRFMVSPDTVMAQPSEAPALSVCRNPKYIKQGTGSLQVQLAVTPSREGFDDAPGFKISGEAIDRIDFTQYSKLQFSVIADADIGTNNLSVIFYDENGTGSGVCADLRSANGIEWNTNIEGDTWYTVTVDLTDLADPDGANRWPIEVNKIESISIFYGNLQSGDSYSFYFDEFTLLKE